MNGPFLVQDWLTLKGKRPTGQTAVTLYPHRDSWVSTANTLSLTLSIEVKNVKATTHTTATPPALRIETAVCDVGPWTTVGTYTAVGNSTLNLNPGGGSPLLLQYLRWAVDNNTGVDGDEWEICFRIVGMRVDFA